MRDKYQGEDNYGRPKSDYIESLKYFSGDDLYRESYNMIYHSARCDNNPKADWHWMVDACYDECKKRDSDIYKKAHDQCVADHT